MAYTITPTPSSIAFGNVEVTRRIYQKLSIKVTRGATDTADVKLVLSRGGTHATRLRMEPVVTPDTTWTGSDVSVESPLTTIPVGSTGATFTAYVSFMHITATTTDALVDVEVQNMSGTTQATLSVTVSATTVATSQRKIAFILDRSGSMATPVAGVSRANRLRMAASAVLDMIPAGDKFAAVTFNHVVPATIALDMLAMNTTHRNAATALFSVSSPDTALDPSGATSIASGFNRAKDDLADNPTHVVILTDGHENTPPLLSSVDTTDLKIWPIGLGLATAVDTGVLTTLASATGNYLLVTGGLTGGLEDEFRLQKLLAQVLLDITDSSFTFDPVASLSVGQSHSWPFQVSEADLGFQVLVFTNNSRLIDLELESPDGTRLTQAEINQLDEAEFSRREGAISIRFSSPPSGQIQAVGNWKGIVRMDKSVLGNDRKPEPTSYAFLVNNKSDLKMQVGMHATGINVGADLLFSATLTEYGVPVEQRAGVEVELTHPDGTLEVLSLQETSPGRFSLTYKPLAPGQYSARMRASGKTFYDADFTREALRTAYLYSAGDGPIDTPAPIPPNEQEGLDDGGAGTPGDDPNDGGGPSGSGSPGDPSFPGFPPDDVLQRLCKRYRGLCRFIEYCRPKTRDHGCCHCHRCGGYHGRCGHGHGYRRKRRCCC